LSREDLSESLKAKRIGRRTFIRLAGIAGGGLILSSCAGAVATPAATKVPAEAPKPTAAPSPEAKAPAPAPKVSANIDFGASAGAVALNGLPMMVAEEMGFFKEEGITEKLVALQANVDIIRGALQGSIQLGNPSNVAVAAAVEEGEVVKIIAENAPFIMAGWIVRADSPIKTLKDIKGKKFGYTAPGSESHIFALSALKSQGLKEGEDVQLVVVRGMADQYTALKNGVIDIAWSVDPMITQGVQNKEIRLLGTPNEIVSNWSMSSVVVSEDYAKKNPDVLRAYLRAYVKAMDFIKSETDKAAEIWAKRAKFTPEIGKEAMKNYPIQKFTAKLSSDIFKTQTEVMLANKLVKQAPQWDKIVDQSYLPSALQIKL